MAAKKEALNKRLFKAVCATPPDIVAATAALDAGADVNASDDFGYSPLYWAVFGNGFLLAQYLLAKGAKVDHVDSAGVTPLMQAAYRQNQKMIDLLLKHGADITALDNSGKNVLAHCNGAPAVNARLLEKLTEKFNAASLHAKKDKAALESGLRLEKDLKPAKRIIFKGGK